MSKLHSKYSDLKQKNPDILYLFKSGIFYLSLQEDAELLSKELGFKLANLTEDIIKCGFPVSKLEHYSNVLRAKKIAFEIIDENYGIINNYSDYLNNEKVKEIIDDIIGVDFNNTSFREAFDILHECSDKLKKIYNKRME